MILKSFPRNVISGIRCIRNPLYPVRAKCGMGCVIVEGDSLALFTTLKKRYIWYTLPLIKLIKSVISLVLKKAVLSSAFSTKSAD